MNRAVLLPLTLASLLAGCAVGPDYRPLSATELKAPDAFGAQLPPADPAAAQPADLTTWWRSFGDPQLTYLVERGLAANLDIDQAGSRLRAARASLREARGQLFPTLSASGQVNRTVGRSGTSFSDPTTGTVFTSGGDVTTYSAGFDASYEADIFGGIRRSIEASRADLGGAEAQLRNVQLSVASEIALNYLDARLAQARLQIARNNLVTQDETLQIVGWRVQAGLVSSLDLEQARQLRAQTAATIPSLEQGYVQAVNRVAILLGEAPGAVTSLLDPAADIPLAPPATDIPASVLQRRPDVAQAERSLAAETARIGVQEAQLYPALRLGGSFSGSDTSVGNVFDAAFGTLFASLSAPIFQGGQIRAAVERQRATAAAAAAAYRQTVLTALEEVENALSAVGTSQRREAEIIVAAEASRNAVLLARNQYQAGLIDFQSLLESERALLSSQDSRATARADRATATVQLYKALGGGWEAAPMPASAQRQTAAAAQPLARP